MVKKGEITRLCRGVYSTSSEDPRLPAAQFILSPSYISFETALSYYQMIPERVYAVISAGYGLKKEKKWGHAVRPVLVSLYPEKVFPLGSVLRHGTGIRTAHGDTEKALCDMLYKIRGIRSLSAIEDLLLDDLRVDEEVLQTLNWDSVEELIPLYHSTTLDSLARWRVKHLS